MKIAEWNPEKDLLAMVTDDSKLLLHRFNWQRLWTISPGFNILHFFSNFDLFFGNFFKIKNLGEESYL